MAGGSVEQSELARVREASTVRDVVEYVSGSDSTVLKNHIDYDAFGRILAQSDANVVTVAYYTEPNQLVGGTATYGVPDGTASGDSTPVGRGYPPLPIKTRRVAGLASRNAAPSGAITPLQTLLD